MIPYIAGVLDVQGKFVFVRDKPKVYLLSKNKKFLEFIQDTLEMGNVFSKGNVFILFIQSREEILRLIKEIEPYILNQKDNLDHFKDGILGNVLSKELLDSPSI